MLLARWHTLWQKSSQKTWYSKNQVKRLDSNRQVTSNFDFALVLRTTLCDFVTSIGFWLCCWHRFSTLYWRKAPLKLDFNCMHCTTKIDFILDFRFSTLHWRLTAQSDGKKPNNFNGLACRKSWISRGHRYEKTCNINCLAGWALYKLRHWYYSVFSCCVLRNYMR